MTRSTVPSLVFPPGRYGRRRDPAYQRRQRWLIRALGVIVVAVGLAIAAKLYFQYAQPPYQVRVISVTDLSDTAVTVTFEVRTPPGEGAACTVLARARDGRQVGRAEVAVPPAGGDRTLARMTYTLPTTARPVTSEVPGCGPTR